MKSSARPPPGSEWGGVICCARSAPKNFEGVPKNLRFLREIVPPETTSSGVPFAESLLANSRNSSTDALRFPIRFNRAIGRPLNSLGSPRIPDPSPARASREPALRHPPPPGPPREPGLRHPPPPGPPGEPGLRHPPPARASREPGLRHPPAGQFGPTAPKPGRPVRPNPNEARPASSAQPQRSPAGSSRGSQREGARPPLHQRHTTPLGSSPGDSVDQDEFAGRFPSGGPRNPRR